MAIELPHTRGGVDGQKRDPAAKPGLVVLSSVQPPALEEPPPARTDDLSVRLLQPLAAYIQATYGAAGLKRVAAASGLEPADFATGTRWITHERFEAALVAIRAQMATDDEFLEACAFGMARSLGAILWVLRTASTRRMFQVMARTVHFVSRISTYELTSSSGTAVRLRYTSKRPESRLMCLSRQGALRALPTYWNLPRASIRETSCIARGEEACVYDLAWLDVARWGPIIGGAVLGIVASVVAMRTGVPPLWSVSALLPLGVAVGAGLETRRAARKNLQIGEENRKALETLAEEHTHAIAEMHELFHRQQEWNRSLEDRVAERDAALEQVARQIRRVRDARTSTLLQLTHDARNPLLALRFSIEALRNPGPRDDMHGLVTDLDAAIERLEQMFDELWTFARSEAGVIHLDPVEVPIPPLVDRLRGSLKALVFGRDISVGVFTTRDSPPSIVVDRLLFDRVVDNIVTNAAKYTERGNIVVEISGGADGLCLKVSDTGRGITRERLEQAFAESRPDPNPIVGKSYGIGLPTVVRLLDQLGGRLEVMSRPGRGTTFWVRIPLKPPRRPSGVQRAPQSVPPLEQVVSRIVVIRAANDTS